MTVQGDGGPAAWDAIDKSESWQPPQHNRRLELMRRGVHRGGDPKVVLPLRAALTVQRALLKRSSWVASYASHS